MVALVLLSLLAADQKPLVGFVGFSADGTRFAWVAPGATKGMRSQFVKIATVGKGAPELSLLMMGDAVSERKARKRLKDFSGKRTPAPDDVTVVAALTLSPPKLTLGRGERRVPVDLGLAPYEKSDVAELWGVSPDGRHVAIRVHGPDVAGGTFELYVVAPLP